MTLSNPEALKTAADALLRQGSEGLCASGRLDVSPFAGQLYEARLATLPLFSAHEFAAAASVEKPSALAVLLSPRQRYDLLVDMVSAARTTIPQLCVALVRLCGPDFHVQLPAELLASDVLLTYDPIALVPRLSREGKTGILTIWQDLRVDRVAGGANRISVAVHDRRSAPGFLEFLEASRTIRALSGLTLSAPARATGALQRASS